jgi:predicted Zn-ribbon and HTH transcriptional regulator
MLGGGGIIVNKRTRWAAEMLSDKVYLLGRPQGVYRVLRRPGSLCRRCYLRASRKLREEIRHRPPSPKEEARALARQHRAAKAAAAEARSKAWKEAATALRLEPATERFECPECGRWADTVEAHRVWARLLRTSLHMYEPLFGILRVDAARAPIRAAYLQRTLDMTFEQAVAALDAAYRLGILSEKGRGMVPAPARCKECYERREASVRDAGRPSARDLIPPQLRFRVFQRDGFRCRYCGRGATQGAILHLDHVVPFSAGGETTEENLLTACDTCNLGKSVSSVLPT